MMSSRSIIRDDVKRTFASYPDPVRTRLLVVRDLILVTADELDGVGAIQETLKWGQPSYLTPETGAGTTIRIAPTRRGSTHDYGLYVHCRTSLISTFRVMFGDVFDYERDRGLLFRTGDGLPTDELRQCIGLALTYHRR